MVYPKDDPSGVRVLDLRGYEEYEEDNKPIIYQENATRAMQDIGLDYTTNEDKNKIIYVILPSNCRITNEVFKEFNNLQIVYNLNKCRSVGYNAFSSCYSLSNSNLSNCEYIGSEAFRWSSITFSNLKKCTFIGYDAFTNCTSLVNIDCSNAVLDDLSFYNCTGLKTIKIKPGIDIPNHTFELCENLQTVYNLNKSSKIGEFAFYGTKKLSNKDLFGVTYFDKCCFSDSNLLGAKINKNAKIASSDPVYNNYSAFAYSNLDKIEIAYNYDHDDHYVLNYCYNLKYIKIPKGMYIPDEFFSDRETVDEIKGRTIYNFKYISHLGGWNLCSVKLTNNTILISDPGEIHSNAFTNCLNTEWNLPNLTTRQVIDKNYFGANVGVIFHCKDGDVTVP